MSAEFVCLGAQKRPDPVQSPLLDDGLAGGRPHVVRHKKELICRSMEI